MPFYVATCQSLIGAPFSKSKGKEGMTCVAWFLLPVPSKSQDSGSMLSWHSYALSDTKESESK